MSMCLDVTDFTKDNMNAWKDLATLCDRPLLEAKTNAKENLGRPRALYYLKPTERKEVLKWLKTLKFSNRYAANIK
jgi:predicted ArsR family transcriptional regulator